jgi:hypothetical protein
MVAQVVRERYCVNADVKLLAWSDEISSNKNTVIVRT